MVTRILCAVLVTATACTFPEQPLPAGNREVVVHSILDPSRRYQLVTLSMTDGAQEVQQELDEATVSITAPDGTVMTAQQDSARDPNGKAINALPDYRVDLQTLGMSLVPGGTYKLRVVVRSGAIITGETTIPDATPAPLPPATSFNRRQDTLRLNWSHVPGARTYDVQVWSGVQFVTEPNYTYYNFASLRYSAFADTSITLAGTAHDWTDSEIFGENTNTRVVVYAVDDNYYEYYRLLGDPFIGAAPTRLVGGFGVFGAIVPLVQRQLTVK